MESIMSTGKTTTKRPFEHAVASSNKGVRLAQRLIKHKQNAVAHYRVKGMFQRGSLTRKKLAANIRRTRAKYPKYGHFLLTH